MQGLTLKRGQGEQLTFTCGGEQVVVHFDDIRHKSATVRVVAPRAVKVWRGPPPLDAADATTRAPLPAAPRSPSAPGATSAPPGR